MVNLRTILMLAAFVAGYFCPWASALNWMIRWLIVGMMLLVMLQVKISWKSFRLQHLWILAANLAVGMGAWGIFTLLGKPELAMVAFFTGITPTATAAPVIIGLLGERVDFAVTAFLVTNIGMAALFPFLIPLAIGNPVPGVFFDVIKSLLIVVGIPVAIAIPVRLLYKGATEIPKRCKNLSFFTWVFVIFLIIGNASAFLHRHGREFSPSLVWKIALLSLGICVLNFWGGRLLGGKRYRQEASQVLGQKNTTLTIYLALTYANPLIALGPTFYVIWHNLWNTWQLHHHGRRLEQRRKHISQ